MRKSFSIILGILFLLLLPAATVRSTAVQGRKKKYVNPLPRKEQILKLFTEEFISVTPGKGKYPKSYFMGSADFADAKPVHRVTFDYSFDMAKYEVTQELYHVVMGKNPSKWTGLRNSVEMMDWHDAKTFCRKVTKELRKRDLIGKHQEIRLPSEAEWEYVCRAGSDSKYGFGNDVAELTHYCWYKDNSKGHDPPVGAKKPNAWGFYDMHGYIWEWCADDWRPGYQGAPADGSPWVVKGAKEKIMRGGSWAHSAEQCRCAYRGHAPQVAENDKIGFRCVLTEAQEKGGSDAE